MDLQEKVNKIVADQLGVQHNGITDDKMVEIFGADSIDIVEIVMDIELEFDCEIEDEEVEEFSTPKDIKEWIEENL